MLQILDEFDSLCHVGQVAVELWLKHWSFGIVCWTLTMTWNLESVMVFMAKAVLIEMEICGLVLVYLPG